MVPVRSFTGELRSLQFIPPPETGKKLNLPGAPVDGVFVVGELKPGATVFVVEGIGQAWACWKATGNAAVVAFGWGRVHAVAESLKAGDAAADVVVVPDGGKGQGAEEVARHIQGRYLKPPGTWPANFDVNDFALSNGFDALEELLAGAHAPSLRYCLMSGDDLRKLPPLDWRVRNVFPAQGLGCVFGPAGSGKSFLALDLAASIAAGSDWFGYRTKSAPVVYVCLEGEAGFRLRVTAWERYFSQPLPSLLRMVLQPFRLTEPHDVQEMGRAVQSFGTGGVTIVDTLNRAAPTMDENTSADMGRIIESSKELQRLTGGLVVVVHHRGKDETRGMRGHSSLHAALDAAIEVNRAGDRREWKVFKAKDATDGGANAFSLKVVELAPDADGEAVSSCVVVRDECATELTRRRVPKGGNQRIAYDALGEILRESRTFGKAGAPPGRPCVEFEHAIEVIAPRLTCEPVRRKERTRQAFTGLVCTKAVEVREGWIWLP